MKYGIDFAQWANISPAQWQEMKAQGVSFAFICGARSGKVDEKVYRHALAAKNADIPFGIYSAISPNYHTGAQIGQLLELCRETGARCACLDFEIYYTPEKVTIENDILSHKINAAIQQMKNRAHLPFIVYTRATFIDGFAWDVDLSNVMLWLADYPYGRIRVTWGEFRNMCLALFRPRLPKGVSHWDAWQFAHSGAGVSSKVGTIEGLDWNVMKDDACYRLFHWVKAEPKKWFVFGRRKQVPV